MRTLKEIALELLDKYAEAQQGKIWEYSSDIDGDIEKLKKVVANYKDEIERSK